MTTSPATTSPATTSPATTSPATTSPATSDLADPNMDPSVGPIDQGLRRRMAHSWRPGCPVGLEDLRHLLVPYWGFDGRSHVGELVVHADVAEQVVSAFVELHAAKFPIERMQLVDDYRADDHTSMVSNNTSAFNCRHVLGSPNWSRHSFGRAIDINPLLNPWVRSSGEVDPPEAAPYVDRDRDAPGMIHEGGAVTAAFARIGWEWGGDWADGPDYQHFEAPD